MRRLLPLVALSALAAAQEVRLLPLVALSVLAAAQEDFGSMFGAAPARDATRGMPHAGRRGHRDAIDATPRRDTPQRRPAEVLRPVQVPKRKGGRAEPLVLQGEEGRLRRAEQRRGHADARTRVHQIATKGRRASSAGGAISRPARRNFGPRETRRFQSRPWIARTAHAERRGGTSTPQVLREAVRADAHRRVLRPAPGLRLDLRHVDEIL